MNSKKWVIIVSVVVVLLMVVVGYLIFQLQKAKNENLEIVEQYSYEAEQMEQNKTQLEQDYVVLSNDLEGFRLQVNNDSILKKLNDEQKRVQLLLEELRTTPFPFTCPHGRPTILTFDTTDLAKMFKRTGFNL